MKNVLVLGATIGLVLAPTIARPAPGFTAVQIARINRTVTGQPIDVPSSPDVVVSIGTFPPGSRLPVHKHPYPHLVYVLDGVLTVTNTETGQHFQVKKGDFVAEMEDTWHYGSNDGKDTVRLLVIDEVPAGTKSNLVPKK